MLSALFIPTFIAGSKRFTRLAGSLRDGAVRVNCCVKNFNLKIQLVRRPKAVAFGYALDLPWDSLGLVCGKKMRNQINERLKEALKSQDKRRVSTLRLINAAIKDRDISARSNGNEDGVSDDDILEILAKMIKQRRESIRTYEEAGRVELAEQEQEEIDIISDFLPKQLDDGEIRAECENVVSELGCEGLKDMGRTMGALKERYAGQMDFSKASAIVKELLG